MVVSPEIWLRRIIGLRFACAEALKYLVHLQFCRATASDLEPTHLNIACLRAESKPGGD